MALGPDGAVLPSYKVAVALSKEACKRHSDRVREIRYKGEEEVEGQAKRHARHLGQSSEGRETRQGRASGSGIGTIALRWQTAIGSAFQKKSIQRDFISFVGSYKRWNAFRWSANRKNMSISG